MGTCEAVRTCTHNLCFEQNSEKYHNFSSENYHFYSCKKSLHISWACFVMCLWMHCLLFYLHLLQNYMYKVVESLS